MMRKKHTPGTIAIVISLLVLPLILNVGLFQKLDLREAKRQHDHVILASEDLEGEVPQAMTQTQRRDGYRPPRMTYFEGRLIDEDTGSRGVVLRLNAQSRKSLRQKAGFEFVPRDHDWNDPNMTEPLPFRIVQASRPHTGSTLITNILVGLFEPDRTLLCSQTAGATVDRCPANHVVKTHTTDIESIESRLNTNGATHVFFVSTNRGKQTIGADYCAHFSNVLCFEYEDLLYSNDDEMQVVVSHVAEEIRGRFPYFADAVLDETSAIQRLREMDKVTEVLSDELFWGVWDLRFGIHGGHRNRKGRHPPGKKRFGKKRVFKG